jgi:hypothetical protein
MDLTSPLSPSFRVGRTNLNVCLKHVIPFRDTRVEQILDANLNLEQTISVLNRT